MIENAPLTLNNIRSFFINFNFTSLDPALTIIFFRSSVDNVVGHITRFIEHPHPVLLPEYLSNKIRLTVAYVGLETDQVFLGVTH